MPSATDDQRSRWDDDSATELLRSHGFTCTQFTWSPPSKAHVLTEDEASAVDYLIDEWDYGYDGGPP